MKIRAKLYNSRESQSIELETNDNKHKISIPLKQTGRGSSANGGELLFLALATCYCNDLYREAAKRKIDVTSVEVDVEGDFGAEGEPARNVAYNAKVVAKASKEEIESLMWATDKLTEIQNTLRLGTAVELRGIEAIEE